MPLLPELKHRLMVLISTSVSDVQDSNARGPFSSSIAIVLILLRALSFIIRKPLSFILYNPLCGLRRLALSGFEVLLRTVAQELDWIEVRWKKHVIQRASVS